MFNIQFTHILNMLKNCQKVLQSVFLFYFIFVFFLVMAVPAICGSFQSKGQVQAAAVAYITATTALESKPQPLPTLQLAAVPYP